MSLRVLYLGENWYGSCARACCYALRRMGCDVTDVDIQTFLPTVRRLSSRASLKILRGRLVQEYNEMILDVASRFEPDLLLAFKGPFLEYGTMQVLRNLGVSMYNYYPDTSAFAHGQWLKRSLPEYDCVFYTKPFWDKDVRSQVSLRQSIFLPHGYDPEVHRSWEVDSRDFHQYQHDVSVMATHTPYKETVLEELVSLKPEIDLRIWGNLWAEHCRSPRLKKFIQGMSVIGTSYAKAIKLARINLAIMSGIVQGASQGDETTTRTYEIPACGGFMLHERSEEVLDLFEEGKEIACFGSVQEMVEKIDYYLAHSDERRAIALAGHERCVPAYSYDNRMAEIIKWHNEHSLQNGAKDELAS